MTFVGSVIDWILWIFLLVLFARMILSWVPVLVRDWEPRIALTPGGDGLSAYREIASGAPERLLPGGRLIVEIGWRQGASVASIFAQAGFGQVDVLQDLNGHDRVVRAIRA